jgi:hypothetical protein
LAVKVRLVALGFGKSFTLWSNEIVFLFTRLSCKLALPLIGFLEITVTALSATVNTFSKPLALKRLGVLTYLTGAGLGAGLTVAATAANGNSKATAAAYTGNLFFKVNCISESE